MEYIVKNKEIVIKIPASNYGKFRFKTRDNKLQFGEIFPTRHKNFSEKIYLEWQIGYDATVIDVRSKKKNTKLRKRSFVSANRKRKYLYELSELIHKGIEIGLVSAKNLKILLEEINKYEEFIDDKRIVVEHDSKIEINGITFEETSIKLPTLFMIETADETQIEVSIQKQQYASSVQPMVYFCIPLKSFVNYKRILGRPSVVGDNLVYVINKRNAGILLTMLKIFSMCSRRHNHDVAEIIKILVK